MDNKDFDKLFSDQLGQEQDFGFREEDWNDLNERMAARQGKRRRFILPFWLAAVGSVLLGGIFYLWYANRLTNNELDELRTEITKLRQEKSIDTVYEELVVYQKDTVFIEMAAQNPGLQNPENKAKVAVLNPDLSTSKTLTDRPQNTTSNQPFQIINKETVVHNGGQHTDQETPIQASQHSADKAALTSELTGILIYAKAQPSMPVLDYPMVFDEQKPAKQQFKLDLGGQLDLLAGAGYVAVKTLDSDTEAVDVDPVGNPNFESIHSKIIKRHSVSAGMQGELVINDNFRLTSGMHYERLKLEVENYPTVENIPGAGTLSLDYDPAFVNIEDYQNAAVLQQTLNYDFGLKYAFTSKNKWRPYLGTAILGQSSLQRNIEYAVDPNRVSTANQAAFLNASTKSTQPVFFYGVRATIGAEYSISEHFGLQAEGNYNYAFRTFEDRHLTLFGLRGGVYFKF